jgi:predicted RNA-binding Zn ribbon-like protein
MNIDAFDFSTIDLLRERLCLDFVNTISNHSQPGEDHLRTYADLVSWGHYTGVINDREAQRLLEIAVRQPAEAATVLHQGIAVREALFQIMLAIADQETPAADALATFNHALGQAAGHMRIVPAGDGFEWDWSDSDDDLNRILWPAVWSAAELIMSDDRRFLRKCGGCDWLFLDTSRNHSRRWCDMKTCGNRAKAHRHYMRTRTKHDEA